MAALLRQGARRIGGPVLQRNQAAVAEERSWLVPRLLHTQTQEHAMSDIQQMKENLYEALSKTEKNFYTKNWRNRRLLQVLAAHVNPRPQDFQWRRLRVSKWVNNFVEAGGTASAFLFLFGTLLSFAEARFDGLKEILEKQEH